MAVKKVILKDGQGNLIYPKTYGSLVMKSDGTAPYCEEGAEVNIIEEVQVNGVALTPDDNRAVNIEIPAAVEYTITKQATAETGYFATYQLFADDTAVGDKINIPKDYLVKSAEVSTVTAADKQDGGKFVDNPDFQVGDKYIDFTVNVKSGTATDEHIYLNVKDLVDVYTGSSSIDISSTNEVSVKITASSGLAVSTTSTDEGLYIVIATAGGLEIDNTGALGIKLDSNSGLSLGANGLTAVGGDGISVGASGIKVNIGDGLTLDGSNNIHINTGSGLSIDTNTDTLNVNVGGDGGLVIDTTSNEIQLVVGTGLEETSDNGLSVKIGDGLDTDASGNIVVKAGNGIVVDADNGVSVLLGSSGALAIDDTDNTLDLVIGNGLEASATDGLSVKVADEGGLEFDSTDDSLKVKLKANVEEDEDQEIEGYTNDIVCDEDGLHMLGAVCYYEEIV